MVGVRKMLDNMFSQKELFYLDDLMPDIACCQGSGKKVIAQIELTVVRSNCFVHGSGGEGSIRVVTCALTMHPI
jgi:hypothetical protein